jgi:hypothetical protein
VLVPFSVDCKYADSFVLIVTVPIFDGRTHRFELNESLKSLDELLPPFESEIPPGSLALVAYTANSYYRSQKSGQSSQRMHSNKNLALNINWVVVLGIPK